MPAYLIARVRVQDPAAYEEYKRLAAAAIEKFGGRYRSRGGTTVTLEGDEETSRVVVRLRAKRFGETAPEPEGRRRVVEFPSVERAEAWYRSPEYQRAIAARRGCATGQFVLIEGLES